MGQYRYIKLTGTEDKKLREIEQSKHLNRKVRLRAQVIRLSHQAWDIEGIAEHVGRSYRSIQRDLERWESLGIEGLADRVKPGKPRILSVEELSYMQDVLAEDRDWNANQLCERLLNDKAIELNDESMRRYLHESGYRWKRTRYVPAGTPDPEKLGSSQRALERLKKNPKKVR
jgi:transposase